MMQSPPCLVEKVVDRFRLGHHRPSGSMVATNKKAVKARTGDARTPLSPDGLAHQDTPGEKVRIELQGRAKTANIISTITTDERTNQAMDRH